jgi:hypothetical protein
LIAREGKAAPAITSTPARTPAASVHRGTNGTIALTVRLDLERYRRLVAYADRFAPRKTHQDILVGALDAYLDQGAAEGFEEAVRVGGFFELRRVEEPLTVNPDGRLGTDEGASHGHMDIHARVDHARLEPLSHHHREPRVDGDKGRLNVRSPITAHVHGRGG